MRFRGKAALVTGATSGIGRAIALRFAREGARVAGTGRREERLRRIREQGVELAVRADHTREEDNRRVLDQALSTFGGLDILVHSAGVIGATGILNTTPEEWRRVMDINLEAMFDLTRQAAPHLKGRPGASIILLSSVCGSRPYANLLPYCVSKAATEMFTRCVALDLAPFGVRVNAIAPGVVVSELHTTSGAVSDYAAFLERSKQTHPLGRPGQPEEIAALAAFLASDEAAWITGTIVSIDGGRHLTSAR